MDYRGAREEAEISIWRFFFFFTITWVRKDNDLNYLGGREQRRTCGWILDMFSGRVYGTSQMFPFSRHGKWSCRGKDYLKRLINLIKKILLILLSRFIYFERERETDRASRGGAEREGKRRSQAGRTRVGAPAHEP